MKITFKAKHTLGVRYMGSEKVESLGNSKIDGFPIFSYEYEDYLEANLLGVWRRFVFNQRPGYTPEIKDFEIINSIEEPFEPKKGTVERYSGKNILVIDDIIPAQALPLPEPLGILYYFDYVLGSEFDERLLLML